VSEQKTTSRRPAGREEFEALVAAIREALSTIPPRHCYSVADLCARWKVGADKVNGLIRRGELPAVNVATNRSGRPQWRVTPEAVAAFEAQRSSAPLPKPTKRRRPSGQTDFFPGD
jgi:hypothetical protein